MYQNSHPSDTHLWNCVSASVT